MNVNGWLNFQPLVFTLEYRTAVSCRAGSPTISSRRLSHIYGAQTR
jgi:hypothetical protein